MKTQITCPCKNVFQVPSEENNTFTKEDCPKCGGMLVIYHYREWFLEGMGFCNYRLFFVPLKFVVSISSPKEIASKFTREELNTNELVQAIENYAILEDTILEFMYRCLLNTGFIEDEEMG